MTPAIHRAAINCRYVLMVRAQYCAEARENLIEGLIDELTAALTAYEDTVPAKPRLRVVKS